MLRTGYRDHAASKRIVLLLQGASRRDAEGQRVARPVDEVRAVTDGGPEVRTPGQRQAAQAEGHLHRGVPLRRLSAAVCRQDGRQLGEARLGVLREWHGHRAAVGVQRVRCRAERMRIAVERQVAHRDDAVHLDHGRIVGLGRIGSRTGVGEGQGAARTLLGNATVHIHSIGAAQLVGGDGVRSGEAEDQRLAVEDRVRGRAHLRHVYTADPCAAWVMVTEPDDAVTAISRYPSLLTARANVITPSYVPKEYCTATSVTSSLQPPSSTACSTVLRRTLDEGPPL